MKERARIAHVFVGCILFASACDKKEAPVAKADPPAPSTAASSPILDVPISAIPAAPATATASASATPSSSAPSPAATTTATATSTTTARPQGAPSSAPPSAPSAAPSSSPSAAPAPAAGGPPASLRKTGDHAIVDVTVASCAAGAECAGTIRLEATDEFHINKEYPYKVVFDAAPGITFLGEGGAGTFGKATGNFTQVAEKVATIGFRFKPAAAGKATIGGTFKMSVCSVTVCKMDPTVFSLVVDVR